MATTLHTLGLTELTPIQARALPAMLAQRSIVVISETGSGKTLSYVLPVLDRLKRLEAAGDPVAEPSEPRALVVVPTRELGEQVASVFKTFTHQTRLRVRTVLGGQKARQNRETVAGAFEVLVSTPGRVERLFRTGALRLSAVRVVVLDEADQLLDLGFLPQVGDVIRACPPERQVALFSATMSAKVEQLASSLFADATLLQSAGRHKVVPTLTTRHVDVPDGRRLGVLLRILEEPTTGGTILFANTRAQCDALAEQLHAAGLGCVVHRGELPPVERRQALRAFREGRFPLLLCTDLAARGLDIEHVARVINVHLPRDLENYLHRVGRTARAGRPGLVVNLVTPRDAPLLQQLGDGSVAPRPVRTSPSGSRPGGAGARRPPGR